MTLAERLASLKAKLKAKIKPESSTEEINEINDLIKELDEVENSHNEVVTENAKFKDVIVRMALNTGDGKKPEDESGGSKPKTIEECVAEELEKQAKEEKGGK